MLFGQLPSVLQSCTAVVSIRHPCAGGSYSRLSGEVSCEVCPAGFACPAGTGVLNLSHVCSSAVQYCPAGSITPATTPEGHFALSVPGPSLLTPVVFVDTQLCPPGQYCIAGVASPCPGPLVFADGAAFAPSPSSVLCNVHCCIVGMTAGRFGNSSGLSTANCTGICMAGYDRRVCNSVHSHSLVRHSRWQRCRYEYHQYCADGCLSCTPQVLL